MPEFVEFIIFTFRVTENMDNNITVIKQEPPRIYRTLMVVGHDTSLLQVPLDFITDGAKLPFTLTGTNDKIVRKAAYITDIK